MHPEDGGPRRGDLLRALGPGQLGRKRNDGSQKSIFNPAVPGIYSLFFLLLFSSKA